MANTRGMTNELRQRRATGPDQGAAGDGDAPEPGGNTTLGNDEAGTRASR